MDRNYFYVSGGVVDKRNGHLINEDRLFESKNYVILLDGATGLSNLNLDDNLTSAEWYVDNILDYLKNRLDINIELNCNDIKNIVKDSIIYMKSLVIKKQDELNIRLKKHDIPSCCLTIVYETIDKIIIFSLGDNYVLIKFNNNENIEIISDPIHNNLDNRVFKLMKKISEENNISIKNARNYVEVNKLLIENREKMNTKCGYYIASIDENACNYAYLKEFNKNDIDKIFICSDGFDFNILDIDINSFIDLVDNDNINNYINEIRYKLKNDKYWNKYRKRFKAIDDITAYVAYKKR